MTALTGYAWWLLIFLLIIPLKSVTGDVNLPPLDPYLRYWINFIFAATLAGYGGIIHQTSHQLKPQLDRKWWIFLFAIAAALCGSMPVFSGDIFENLIRGRILGIHHMSPYAHLPKEFPQDLLFNRSIWQDFPADYGPLWVYLQTLPVLLFKNSVGGMVWIYKLLMLAAFIMALIYYKRLTENLPFKDSSSALLVLALNPLLIVMSFIDGHQDIVMLAFLIISVYCLSIKKTTWCLIFWALSFMVKYPAILSFPFIALAAFKTERQKRGHVPTKWAFKQIFIITLLFAGFYWPIWGGAQAHFVLIGYAKWFYTNTLPYAIHQGLGLVGIDVPTQLVAHLFFGTFVVLYVYLLWKCWWEKYPLSVLFFRAMTLIHVAFILQMTAPFHGWYLLWALPWLILSRFPKSTALVVIYTAVGLFSYWKRINYLMLMGIITYASLVIARPRQPTAGPPEAERGRSNPY
jgi:hypothetical protein